MEIHESRLGEFYRSLRDLHLKVDSLIAEIGPGIPPPDQRGGRETLRDRLHRTESDVQAARLLGESLLSGLSDVKTIAVRSGGVSEEMLFEAGAAYVFASVKDLFDNYTTSPLQD